MQLYLMRHGKPLTASEDPEEGLSIEGKESILQNAKALKRLSVQFDYILCSPKKRSQETAMIVAQELGIDKEQIKESVAIKPMASTDDLLNFLSEFSRTSCILIAGHLPSLSLLTSSLISQADHLGLNIETGGLLKIQVEDLFTNSSILEWFVSPNLLKQIKEPL